MEQMMTTPSTERAYATFAYMSTKIGVEVAGDPLRDGLVIGDDRHPGTKHMSKLFAFGHLPPRLQDVSVRFAMLGQFMVDAMSDGPELTEALRKLWESKNSAVIHAGFLGNLVGTDSAFDQVSAGQGELDIHYNSLPPGMDVRGRTKDDMNYAAAKEQGEQRFLEGRTKSYEKGTSEDPTWR
jgi:hypothetical protein